MKKFLKSFMTLFAVIAMVLSLTTIVQAEETYYTITINNPTIGHAYEAYQVFTGDLSSDGKTLSNVIWGNGVNGENILLILKSIYVDANLSSPADVAKALDAGTIDASKFADIVNNNLTNNLHTSTYSNSMYTINNLPAGYYFVKDQDNSVDGQDSYTKFMLKVVNNVEATPKTDTPSSEKKVYENVKPSKDPKSGNAGDNYNDVADYNIGDKVPFAFYSTIPDMQYYDTYKYIFEDKMDSGLSFNNDVSVSIISQEGTTILTSNLYQVVTSTGDECTFHVVISNLKGISSAKTGAQIRVDFTATLNENAVIGLDGNENQMRLKFSNNPNDSGSGSPANGETPWDKVIVFTYQLDVTKVDDKDDTKKLENAQFILYRQVQGKNEYVKVDENNKVSSWKENESEASIVSSDENGFFTIIGLDDGTYFLKEVQAPDGYNLLKDPIQITITATTVNNQSWTGVASDALTKLTLTSNNQSIDGNTDTGIVAMSIGNESGSVLPNTGGIGNYVFYGVGGILMIGAAYYFVRKRNKKNI